MLIICALTVALTVVWVSVAESMSVITRIGDVAFSTCLWHCRKVDHAELLWGMSLLYDDSIAVEFTKVWPHLEDCVCVIICIWESETA